MSAYDIQCVETGLKVALNDIRNASSGGAKMGAFILCSCLIDSITGFRIGGDSRGSDYQSTVSIYLSSYNPSKLYCDLRCKLVHTYSEGGSYWFCDNKPSLHLTVDSTTGKTIINLENFINEIEIALGKFISDARTNSTIENNLSSRLLNNGIIEVAAITNSCGSYIVSGSN